MKMQSGILLFTKAEQKDMELVLRHAERDLEYGWDGSYGGHEVDDKREEARAQKEIASSKRGIELIRWIIDNYKK